MDSFHRLALSRSERRSEMNKYERDTIKFLIGKTIKDVEINGFCFNITFTDNSKIEYNASDAGYSSWGIKEAKGETDEQ